MLDWVVRAASKAALVDEIVVATSIDGSDDPIEAHCVAAGVRCHRGPLDDVLERFRGAVAAERSTDGVVRLTADCPLLDPTLIDACVATWRASGVDYVSTVSPRSLPRGLDVEVVSVGCLRSLAEVARGVDRVHVTSHLSAHPDSFDRLGVVATPDASHLRVTLDTVDDARLLDALVARLGDGVHGWKDVVEALDSDPDLRALNAHVRQKAVVEG